MEELFELMLQAISTLIPKRVRNWIMQQNCVFTYDPSGNVFFACSFPVCADLYIAVFCCSALLQILSLAVTMA